MKTTLSDDATQQIARYFKALSDPNRIKILNRLLTEDGNVGELALACDCSLANASKHLSLLAKQGMVTKHRVGTRVYYRITDVSIGTLCDLVCGNIIVHLEQQARIATQMHIDQEKSR